MARTDSGLKVLSPEPVTNERSHLLGDSGEGPAAYNNSLEAQAEQELREHDVGATPLAEEPSTKKLVFTMGSLWLSTFFAAMGTGIASRAASLQLTIHRRNYCRYSQWSNFSVVQLWYLVFVDCLWVPHRQRCLPTAFRQNDRHVC